MDISILRDKIRQFEHALEIGHYPNNGAWMAGYIQVLRNVGGSLFDEHGWVGPASAVAKDEFDSLMAQLNHLLGIVTELDGYLNSWPLNEI